MLYAVATEVTDELERAPQDQDRLQDELDCSCKDMATTAREFSNCWTAQEAANAKNKQHLQRNLQSPCYTRGDLRRGSESVAKNIQSKEEGLFLPQGKNEAHPP